MSGLFQPKSFERQMRSAHPAEGKAITLRRDASAEYCFLISSTSNPELSAISAVGGVDDSKEYSVISPDLVERLHQTQVPLPPGLAQLRHSAIGYIDPKFYVSLVLASPGIGLRSVKADILVGPKPWPGGSRALFLGRNLLGKLKKEKYDIEYADDEVTASSERPTASAVFDAAPAHKGLEHDPDETEPTSGPGAASGSVMSAPEKKTYAFNR